MVMSNVHRNNLTLSVRCSGRYCHYSTDKYDKDNPVFQLLVFVCNRKFVISTLSVCKIFIPENGILKFIVKLNGYFVPHHRILFEYQSTGIIWALARAPDLHLNIHQLVT